jgi:hypothetical protein
MRHGRRLAWLDALLLAAGGALAYGALQRRWGYYAGTPFSPAELARLIPADRAALTVWWWDNYNYLCGPLPAIWPALALLAALPMAVAAPRGRTIGWRWGSYSRMCAVFGAITVLAAMGEFVVRSQMSDSGWVYAVDRGTFAMALGGYALLFLGAWLLGRVTSGSGSSAASG